MTLSPLPLKTKCKRCHGTGTIFTGKTLKVGASSRCPDCKGSCFIPFTPKGQPK